MKKIHLMAMTVVMSGLLLTGCVSESMKPIPTIESAHAQKYQDYTPEKMAQLKGTRPFMIFFYAEWCGTCKAWQSRILSSVADLPAGTRILRADYDNSESLRKEYGVTTQSMGVFFDASGAKVKNSPDPKVSEVVEFFQAKNTGTIEAGIISEKAVSETQAAQIEGVDLAHYTDYSTTKFDMLKGSQKFVVFFYSDWCGTCRAWEAKVKEASSMLPMNTIILKANYDEDKDLVKAWHVKSQSTAVFFNQNGEIVDTVLDPSLEKLSSFFSN